MNLRCPGTRVIATPVPLFSLIILLSAPGSSSAQNSSATRVAAEVTAGKLSSAESKTGDIVSLRLTNDLRSNGQVVLKRGAVITGIVRSVGHTEPKTHAQSMIEVDWVVPSAEGQPRSVSVALQSVMQVNAAFQAGDADAAGDKVSAASHASGKQSNPAAAGGALFTANPALLSMPSVVAVDHQTSSAIETTLDSSESGTLFKVGHGELIGAGGARESVDLFSHLNNDTVITSPSRNFEISSGAQLQLLVGVRK